MLGFSRIWLCFAIILSTLADEDPDISRLKASGAEYLHNVMEQLQHDREEGQSVEIMELTNILNMDRVSEPSTIIRGPTPLPGFSGAEARPLSPPPPPSLSAVELDAIYKAALAKGATLPQLQGAPSVNQFIHSPASSPSSNHHVVQPASQGVSDAHPGYYYYYYPIKSFGTTPQSQALVTAPSGLTPPPVSTPAPHNAAMMDTSTSKGVEPLFMAMTGFVSMAVMFIVTVLFLPKLGSIRSGDVPELKEAPNELAVFGKLIIESMDGKDCTERIACEVGRVVRQMKLEKPFKILEIVLPPNLSRQIVMVRKAAVKREKCNYISCRLKSERPPAKMNVKKDTWKKGLSPHELWMKHFEKEKLAWKNPTRTK